MKWIVMRYIQILIDYGDYYFRQNSLETIPNAIQMYIMASHLYGPRGQKLKREGKVKAYTYNNRKLAYSPEIWSLKIASLVIKWESYLQLLFTLHITQPFANTCYIVLGKFDAFSNAMVQMEDSFPFSNQTSLPVGKLPNDGEAQMANVFGFAGTMYFTIPDNPNLTALRDTIDDRLFKIRHSQDINGVFRQLPLFDPPIDPGLLVQAAAKGLSLSSVLSDLNGPMPNYRFQYLLQRALDLTSEVKAFGQALLSAREKQDAESHSVLIATHDTVTQSLVMEMKKFALDQENSNLEALRYSRKGPENRLKYYLQLSGLDNSAIPASCDEFQEVDQQLEAPVKVGSLQVLPAEKMEMDLNIAAGAITTVVNAMEALAGVFNALPSTGAHATPLGCGAVINWGPPNVGAATSAIARGVSVTAGELQFLSSVAGRKGQSQRALSDRLQAANAAGYEISSIDKQIAAGQIRVAMASKDIEVQQKQIDQAKEVENFIRSKYTNADLYGWISGQTKTLYYQTYTQAYDLAKKVEKAFKFERPQLAGTTFIQPGYWDASRDGLLAGESLYYALKQLEATYISNKGYDYEVTKNISLRQINPMQLLALRETGNCTFSVPEILFDMDFPGHYLRRIKSVSITIPCVVGPYISMNATLRLTSSTYRTNTSLDGGYAANASTTSGTDPRFATTNVPLTAIAVSSGQADAGVFELSFTGDRYMPFEGAGAISNWSLQLPTALRPFEYGSIADVILTMRYTSVEGGSALQDQANKAAAAYVAAVDTASNSGGLCALFDVKNEFATGWSALSQGSGELEMKDLRGRLPLFAVGKPKGSVTAAEIYLLSDGALSGNTVTVTVSDGGNNTAVLTQQSSTYSGLTAYVNTTANIPVETWKLQMPAKKLEVKRLWVFVKYTLK
jgi:receptor-binding and translocation channel-forming TcA subunit of Tc toxin